MGGHYFRARAFEQARTRRRGGCLLRSSHLRAIRAIALRRMHECRVTVAAILSLRDCVCDGLRERRLVREVNGRIAPARAEVHRVQGVKVRICEEAGKGIKFLYVATFALVKRTRE